MKFIVLFCHAVYKLGEKIHSSVLNLDILLLKDSLNSFSLSGKRNNCPFFKSISPQLSLKKYFFTKNSSNCGKIEFNKVVS